MKSPLRSKPSWKDVQDLSMLYNYRGGLWYVPEWNRFTDSKGIIIANIAEYFEPWRIEQWKEYCEVTGIGMSKVQDRWGRMVEIFYIIGDIDEANLENLMLLNMHFVDECFPVEHWLGEVGEFNLGKNEEE